MSSDWLSLRVSFVIFFFKHMPCLSFQQVGVKAPSKVGFAWAGLLMN